MPVSVVLNPWCRIALASSNDRYARRTAVDTCRVKKLPSALRSADTDNALVRIYRKSDPRIPVGMARVP